MRPCHRLTPQASCELRHVQHTTLGQGLQSGLGYKQRCSSSCGQARATYVAWRLTRTQTAGSPARSHSFFRLRVAKCCATQNSGSVTREVLSRSERSKLDLQEDRTFYDTPRLVKHVDESFLRQVTQLYRERIPAGGTVLDLMSSWISHLPEDVTYQRVVGHGMNAAELARNKRLDEFFVRDLNQQPDGWAVSERTFDAVLICVSVQYLQQPERVFAEIYRVLKPGGVCIITFSNRQYYSKAIQAWRDNTGFGRVSLVRQYFQCVSGFTEPEGLTQVGVPEPTDFWRKARRRLQMFVERAQGDPFYAVISYRNFKIVN